MKSKRTKASTLRATAYHEAGHAVAACRLGVGLRQQGASIIPGRDFAGLCFMRRSLRGKPDVDNSDAMRLRVERLAIIQLSGDHRAAQIQPAQRPFVSCIGDYQSAVSLTEHFVGGDEELEAYLNLLAIRAKSLIEFHWDDVIAVADALLERRSLTAPQVRQILRM